MYATAPLTAEEVATIDEAGANGPPSFGFLTTYRQKLSSPKAALIVILMVLAALRLFYN